MAEEKYKIVVFGAFGAGKSTLIQTLDPQAKHIEAECAGGTTTIALDYGRVPDRRKKGLPVRDPGQERFEFAREIIGKGMDGAILLVDATSPVDEFVEHLHTSIGAEKIPFVVFLNKCDAVGAQPDAGKSAFRRCRVRNCFIKGPQTGTHALSKGFIGTLRPQPPAVVGISGRCPEHPHQRCFFCPGAARVPLPSPLCRARILRPASGSRRQSSARPHGLFLRSPRSRPPRLQAARPCTLGARISCTWKIPASLTCGSQGRWAFLSLF